MFNLRGVRCDAGSDKPVWRIRKAEGSKRQKIEKLSMREAIESRNKGFNKPSTKGAKQFAYGVSAEWECRPKVTAREAQPHRVISENRFASFV